MFASNTSTLVLLAKVGCLEKFIEISSKIEIPSQVKLEALFYKDSYDARLINKLIQDSKIIVISVDKKEIVDIMKGFNFDEGEAATYVIFNKNKHKAILTDDGELIKLCKLEKIPFICAMAIIIILYEKKSLLKEEAIEKIEELNKIGRYSKELHDYFKGEIK